VIPHHHYTHMHINDWKPVRIFRRYRLTNLPLTIKQKTKREPSRAESEIC
jgi:hypothetical protein